jgi:hypothetical protein
MLHAKVNGQLASGHNQSRQMDDIGKHAAVRGDFLSLRHAVTAIPWRKPSTLAKIGSQCPAERRALIAEAKRACGNSVLQKSK